MDAPHIKIFRPDVNALHEFYVYMAHSVVCPLRPWIQICDLSAICDLKFVLQLTRKLLQLTDPASASSDIAITL